MSFGRFIPRSSEGVARGIPVDPAAFGWTRPDQCMRAETFPLRGDDTMCWSGSFRSGIALLRLVIARTGRKIGDWAVLIQLRLQRGEKSVCETLAGRGQAHQSFRDRRCNSVRFGSRFGCATEAGGGSPPSGVGLKEYLNPRIYRWTYRRDEDAVIDAEGMLCGMVAFWHAEPAAWLKDNVGYLPELVWDDSGDYVCFRARFKAGMHAEAFVERYWWRLG